MATNTNVLMYCPNRGVTNEERIEFGWAVSTTGNRNTWATHWMPLPEFPMGSTVAGEVANQLGGLDTTCPTCGGHDCQGGLPCETGDAA